MALTLFNLILIGTLIYFSDETEKLLTSILSEQDLERSFRIIGKGERSPFMKQRFAKFKQTSYLFVFCGLLPNSLTWEVAMALLCYVVYKYPYWQLKVAIRKQTSLVRYQFPIYLRQLQVLLQNNTVVFAIEQSIDHAPDSLKGEINYLHQQLLAEPHQLNHYLHFLDYYALPEVGRAMKLLYRYNTVGQADSYRQFNRMIQSTSKWLRQERQQHKSTQLLIYQWWGLVPLFSVTLVFLSVMMNILLTMFGKGVNG